MATFSPRAPYGGQEAGNGPALAPLDAAARAHSDALAEAIRAEIRSRGGSIGFERFMDLALYHPALGYYRSGTVKFGQGGDFVTAPEISPLFGQTLARHCARVLGEMNGAAILEFGAGTGRLAVELLAALEAVHALPSRYDILELSAELRTRQRDTLLARLPQVAQRVRWLEQLPDNFRGVVLANEVLDAMPVQCFEVGEDSFYERRVGIDEQGNFVWVRRLADTALAARLAHITDDLLEPLDAGYCSELNPQLEAWLAALASSVNEGLVLLIDYGYPRKEYYHPQRRHGTLLCHYRHRAHDDPFWALGLQDISANVDFTVVAEAAVQAGFEVLSYTTQASFLLANALAQSLAQANSDTQRLQYAQHIKHLTLPGEMGERFHVMALGKRFAWPAERFALRDYRARL